ncbi:malate synthase A [Rhodospirillaceae bacterium KN72]|uniref:Malate synthase n=1 Tax=Pacificispira spongiicola TaxID=2729598 RepID=A0A7Y0DZF3_9PROT|nr:malate synthase A [Pacificispira spongiicola]NMM44428.1 malate synthase A [Pacificispira spongiicola]
MTVKTATTEGVALTGAMKPGYETVLTDEAVAFIAHLERLFGERRRELLAAREARQTKIDAGELPDFLPETQSVRDGDWKIAPLPDDLKDRRVEITGPTDRKMVINALNSGAYVFMADLEDSNCPTWDNMIGGQINLRDAVNRSIDFKDPASGKEYALKDKTAVLLVRPRGWHLEEKHIAVDGLPMSGGIVDFGLYFFHNHAALKARGTGPYFYLPKMESHLEARLWNDIFVEAQSYLGVPKGTIKATVLIETILAAFEMDEILYELRDHSAGLNCGRWDYIFSIIKKFRRNADFVMPDRSLVTMTVRNMRAYSLLAVKTCHKRGAPCIGGMAAQIPVKGDETANAAAFAKVKADKEREANDGHDGSWVAHPGLVPVALDAFNAVMKGPNQIDRLRDDVTVTAEDLLAVPEGGITEAGVRTNIQVGIRYTEAWLGGNGCVPLFNLMEDAATAEISRAQLWQWAKHGAVTVEGIKLGREAISGMIAEEMKKIEADAGGSLAGTRFVQAGKLFEKMALAEDFPTFLTLPAYEMVLADGG